MFCAAITSVVGAAYTSVSFLKTFSAQIEQKERFVIIGFIVLSTIIFVIVGNPAQVLEVVALFNGFILPFALGLILLAARKKQIVGEYVHPLWLQIAGWLVVLIMSGFSLWTIYDFFAKNI